MRIYFPLLCVFLVLFSCSSEKKEDEKTKRTNDTVTQPVPGYIPPVKLENIETKYPNGRLKVKGILKNGKREGLWISWYESGQEWSESVYKNGLKNGTTASWHENGMKRYDGFYTNDTKTGQWTYWDDKGKLVEEAGNDNAPK